MELNIEEYEWKDLFLFEFIHVENSEKILRIVKNLTSSTTFNRKE